MKKMDRRLEKCVAENAIISKNNPLILKGDGFISFRREFLYSKRNAEKF